MDYNNIILHDFSTQVGIKARRKEGRTRINKEEGYNKLKGHYNDAMKVFKEKYGFRPYKAGYLKQKAWEEEKGDD